MLRTTRCLAKDPVYAVPGKPLKGQQAIRDFYAWREGRGSRVARHCILNFHAAPAGPDRAVCDWAWCSGRRSISNLLALMKSAIRLANRANAQTRTISSAYGAHGVLT
jgi:hypothetical protein